MSHCNIAFMNVFTLFHYVTLFSLLTVSHLCYEYMYKRVILMCNDVDYPKEDWVNQYLFTYLVSLK